MFGINLHHSTLELGELEQLMLTDSLITHYNNFYSALLNNDLIFRHHRMTNKMFPGL